MKNLIRICGTLLLCLALAACNKVVTQPSLPTPDSVKHRLYLDDYRVNLGVVELPESCGWGVSAGVDPSWNGYVLLVLEETRSETVSLRPVMSYLTPEEAQELSDLLRDAASQCAWIRERSGEATPSLETGAKETPDKEQGTVIEPSIGVDIPSVRLQNANLSELLHNLLDPMGLDYEIYPGFVWISRPDLLAGESSVPDEVLAEIRVEDHRSQDDLAEEVMKKLELPVAADLHAGQPVTEVLDFLSDYFDLKLVLDERVILSGTPSSASPEPKHEIYLYDFKILPGRTITLPDACFWDVLLTVSWRGKNHVVLELRKAESESMYSLPMLSYLTPGEAADLSEQLEKAAADARNGKH